jgi:hypothetical protein
MNTHNGNSRYVDVLDVGTTADLGEPNYSVEDGWKNPR